MYMLLSLLSGGTPLRLNDGTLSDSDSDLLAIERTAAYGNAELGGEWATSEERETALAKSRAQLQKQLDLAKEYGVLELAAAATKEARSKLLSGLQPAEDERTATALGYRKLTKPLRPMFRKRFGEKGPHYRAPFTFLTPVQGVPWLWAASELSKEWLEEVGVLRPDPSKPFETAHLPLAHAACPPDDAATAAVRTEVDKLSASNKLAILSFHEGRYLVGGRMTLDKCFLKAYRGEATPGGGGDGEAESGTRAVEYVRLPVPDFSLPSEQQLTDFLKAVGAHAEGDTLVVMHCGSGHGRSGFQAAVLWSVLHGEHVLEAMLRLEDFDARSTFDAAQQKLGALAFHELTEVNTEKEYDEELSNGTEIEVSKAQLFAARIDAWALWLQPFVEELGEAQLEAWRKWRAKLRADFQLPWGYPWGTSALGLPMQEADDW